MYVEEESNRYGVSPTPKIDVPMPGRHADPFTPRTVTQEAY